MASIFTIQHSFALRALKTKTVILLLNKGKEVGQEQSSGEQAVTEAGSQPVTQIRI